MVKRILIGIAAVVLAIGVGAITYTYFPGVGGMVFRLVFAVIAGGLAGEYVFGGTRMDPSAKNE